MRAPDRRVRERHLQLADAYSFRLGEEKRRTDMQLLFRDDTASKRPLRGVANIQESC